MTFHVDRAETLALVSESGCGKTTMANLAMRLQKSDSGTIRPLDTDITKLRTRELRIHRRHLQMIFQDPFASLTPCKTVGKIVRDPVRLNRTASNSEIDSRVAELFELVGLSADDTREYPHHFSGGQRQRICIVRALTFNPSLIVADEAVSALEVSVRATVLNLMIELQQEFDLSYLFVSHDLAVVARIARRIAHRVAVMYLGQIVEMGPRRQVFENPQHSYTQRLMDAAPIANPGQRRERALISGEIPSPVRPEDEGPERVTLRDLGGGRLVAVE